MISVDDLTKLVGEYASIFKKSFSIIDGKPVMKEGTEFYPTYQLAIKYRDKISIHSEIGEFPEKMFLAKAPNMSEREYEYLKANYKQTTTSVYSDYFATIMRSWADGNWNMSFTNDLKDSFQDYLSYNIYLFGSIENYFKTYITHLVNTDPNGVIAIKIHDMAVILNEDGELILDDTKLPEPQPHFYRCDQVIHKMPGEHYMILTDNYSNVEYGGGTKNIGLVLEFYDEQNIYRITQVGKQVDWTFQIELLFNHQYGEVPVTELKGMPKMVKNDIVWLSPFLTACDNLDLALMNAQYLQVSVTTVCFPYRIMVGSECMFEVKDEETSQIIHCESGYLNFPDMTRRKCSSCNGSGLQDRVSPFGVLLLNTEDWQGKGDSSLAGKAMTYVSPDTSALQFVSDKIDKDTDSARKILHLQSSNSEVKGSQNLTATGMGIDQTTQYSFIKPISERIFSAFEFVIDAMGWMRYADKYEDIRPVIMYPSTFDYKTEGDYLAQISQAQKDGLPPAMIHQIFYRFLQTHYFYEKKTNDIFKLIVNADRILIMSPDDVALKFSKGLVSKEEVVLHDSAITLVDELLLVNSDLFTLSIEEQVVQLKAKAKEVADGIKTFAQRNQQTTVNDILNIG